MPQQFAALIQYDKFPKSPICMYPLHKILTSKKIKRTCLSIFEKQHDLRRIFTCFYFSLDNIYKTCYNIHKLFLVLFHGNLKDIIHRGSHHHFYPNVLHAPTSQGTPSCSNFLLSCVSQASKTIICYLVIWHCLL